MPRLLTSYIAAFRGLPLGVWALSGATFINSSGRMAITLLSLYLTQAKGYDVAFAGQVIAAFGLGSIAGGWLAGPVCDRLPIRWTLCGSLALNGLGFIAIQTASAPWQYVAVVLFAGFFEGAYRPAFSVTLMGMLPPSERARGHSLNRTAINLGVAGGAALGGALAAFDFELVFWADGLTCLAAAALMWRVVGPSAGSNRERARAGAQGSPWRDGWFLSFCVLLSLTSCVFLQIYSTYGPYLATHYGLGPRAYGLLFSLNGLLIFFCELPLVNWLKRYDLSHIAAFGTLMVGLAFAMLPLGGSAAFAVLSMLVLTLGEMTLYSAAMSLAMNRAAPGREGATMSVYFTFSALSRLAAPAVGSLVYDGFGPNVLWAACGAVTVLSCVGMVALRHRPALVSRSVRSP